MTIFTDKKNLRGAIIWLARLAAKAGHGGSILVSPAKGGFDLLHVESRGQACTRISKRVSRFVAGNPGWISASNTPEGEMVSDVWQEKRGKIISCQSACKGSFGVGDLQELPAGRSPALQAKLDALRARA